MGNSLLTQNSVCSEPSVPGTLSMETDAPRRSAIRRRRPKRPSTPPGDSEFDEAVVSKLRTYAAHLVSEKQFRAATQEYSRIIAFSSGREQSPDFLSRANAYWSLGEMQSTSEEDREALLDSYQFCLRDVEVVLSRPPAQSSESDSWTTHYGGYFVRSRAHEMMGELELSLEDAKKAAEHHPEDLFDRLFVARIYLRLERFEEAVMVYSQVFRRADERCVRQGFAAQVMRDTHRLLSLPLRAYAFCHLGDFRAADADLQAAYALRKRGRPFFTFLDATRGVDLDRLLNFVPHLDQTAEVSIRLKQAIETLISERE